MSVLNAKVFIGSASESDQWANAVHRALNPTVNSKTWRHGTFAATGYPVTSLLEEISHSDFGVFICEGIDHITGLDGPDGRNEATRLAVRDNVIFELGMFISALGMERTFILVPSDDASGVKMPSDLSGVTFEYFRRNQSPEAAVQPACDHILARIRSLGPATGGLSGLIASSSETLAKYLGLTEPTAMIIAHCEQHKWEHEGLLAPGARLGNEIVSLGAARPRLESLPDPPAATVNWDILGESPTLFLVDSPYFNPYSRQILDRYQNHVTGGVISYSTDLATNLIDVGRETPYSSNKHPRFANDLFGRFWDYVLLMRLPGEVAESGNDRLRVVWLMYGLTTKGSHAGACLFRLENFRQFERRLRNEVKERLPEYFEAVFKVREVKDKVEDFGDLDLVHFARLRPHRERFAGDPVPASPERFFSRDSVGGIDQGDAPICSVHLDLAAGCNFNCETCIEREARDRNLFLSIRKVARILVDLRKTGCRDLRFYGGEPTLHPDFPDIVELASELGFDMTLVTNGSMLGANRIAGALTRAAITGRMRVRVSLDANTPETHAAHHRCKEAEFQQIVEAMTKLIDDGVPVSVSYLLTTGSLRELENACAFWSRAKAEAFMPRILMRPNGKWLEPDSMVRIALESVLRQHQSWVVVPPWLTEWLRNKPASRTQHAQNQFRFCYSGAFRLVISPLAKVSKQTTAAQAEGASAHQDETDDAWISSCSYFRYENSTGCEYPADFSEWCKNKRAQFLAKISPAAGLCTGVVCSRAGLNRRVEEALTARPL
jgi:molybdenum cofactor biosynthesis enzyme MoaA